MTQLLTMTTTQKFPLQHNDIAILTLAESVKYTDNIQPICLAVGQNQYVGSRQVRESYKDRCVMAKIVDMIMMHDILCIPI